MALSSSPSIACSVSSEFLERFTQMRDRLRLIEAHCDRLGYAQRVTVHQKQQELVADAVPPCLRSQLAEARRSD
jgi:hypothetical protein